MHPNPTPEGAPFYIASRYRLRFFPVDNRSVHATLTLLLHACLMRESSTNGPKQIFIRHSIRFYPAAIRSDHPCRDEVVAGSSIFAREVAQPTAQRKAGAHRANLTKHRCKTIGSSSRQNLLSRVPGADPCAFRFAGSTATPFI
jgi:hypothetical protein